MISLRPKHVRTRLTLWYLVLLGGILALFIAAAAGFLFFNLRRELDRELADQIESVEQGLNFGPDGKLQVGQAGDHADPDRLQEPYLEIRELDGTVLYRNDRLAEAQLGGMPTPGEGTDGYSPRSSRLRDRTRIRLASRVDFVESHPVLIRIAASEERLWNDIRHAAWAVLAAFPIVLIVAGFLAFGLAKRFLDPLGAMAARAEEITAERLGPRGVGWCIGCRFQVGSSRRGADPFKGTAGSRPLAIKSCRTTVLCLRDPAGGRFLDPTFHARGSSAVRKLYPNHAEEAIKVYGAASNASVG